MRDIATIQQRQIEAARKALKPTPVEQGSIPRWLTDHLLKRNGTRYGITGGWMVLEKAIQDTDARAAFDHYGRTKLAGEWVLVSEPYPNAGAVEAAQRFADHFGLDLSYSSNSWWYPGSTLRFIFRPKREGQ